MEEVFIVVIWFLFGGICIADFIYNMKTRKACSQKILASYKTCRTNMKYNVAAPQTYTPCFTYEWNGQEYHAMPVDANLSKRQIMKYHSWEQYEIYLNPKKPEMIRLHRKCTIANVGILVFGLFLLLVGVLFCMR